MDAVGKFVAGRRYFHTSTVSSLEPTVVEILSTATSLAAIEPNHDYNVVRIDQLNETVSLLSYPDFFDEAFPHLARSWKVNLSAQRVAFRNYEDSLNPPILHRKELLLTSDDPRRAVYERLSAEMDSVGLFDDPVRIGFKLQWERLLEERGFRIVDHQLVPIGNEEAPPGEAARSSESVEIARHLTALSRQNLSAPIQLLQRYGLLDGSRTLFDYGCGKGDDVRALIANNIGAGGWDPHYAPANPIGSAHIVNLGFVINVIEDPVERRVAIQRAYSLSKELLVVSTMLATENPGRVTFYGDGVLTSRSTFQKYYTQGELRDYIADTLGADPIPVAPGIFFVFSDKDAEQRFQVARYRSRIRVRHLVRPVRISPSPRPRKGRDAPLDKYLLHRELLDSLWAQCLELGREPDRSEIPNLEAIEVSLGSLRKAMRYVFSRNELSLLERARNQRTDDLKVLLALQQFQKRQPYKRLEDGLQRDIRAFFGDYKSAQEHARQLLYQVAQPEVLDEACEIASELGLGWLERGHSLQLHSSLVPRLPAPLRVYVGCAGVLYGDISDVDVVKIHIRSGKVSFMKYEDFFGSPLPRMTERIKIHLRNLDLQLFAYGGAYPSPLLYLKSRYINEELPNYPEQLAFDQELQSLDLVDLSGFGPSAEEFHQILNQARWSVDRFHLRRSQASANLDERCGRYFTYRDLIQCGHTQASTGLTNLPENPESYTALHELAKNILDPVIEYFGGIELTYGFCSPELAKLVPARISPELDQHAASEKRRSGKPVCSRLGAAVDFFIRDENMREVADWIINTLPYDRLYFYGNDRPLHVSYGPEHKRHSVEMVQTAKGRRMPRPYRQQNT